MYTLVSYLTRSVRYSILLIFIIYITLLATLAGEGGGGRYNK